MFSIKPTEIQDANTGVHVAFGDYEADGKTCWMRITAPGKKVYGEAAPRPGAMTTMLFSRDGEVLRIIKHEPAPPPAEVPEDYSPLTDEEIDARIDAQRNAVLAAKAAAGPLGKDWHDVQAENHPDPAAAKAALVSERVPVETSPVPDEKFNPTQVGVDGSAQTQPVYEKPDTSPQDMQRYGAPPPDAPDWKPTPPPENTFAKGPRVDGDGRPA